MKPEAQIAMHAADSGHTFDLAHAKVVDTEVYAIERLLKEAWYMSFACSFRLFSKRRPVCAMY